MIGLPTHTCQWDDTRIEGLALYADPKVQGIKGKSPNGGGALIIRVSMRVCLPYLGNAKTMPRKGSAGRLRYFTNNGLMMAQIRGNSQKRNLTRMPIRSIFEAVERRHLSCKWAHMGARTWEALSSLQSIKGSGSVQRGMMPCGHPALEWLDTIHAYSAWHSGHGVPHVT